MVYPKDNHQFIFFLVNTSRSNTNYNGNTIREGFGMRSELITSSLSLVLFSLISENILISKTIFHFKWRFTVL